MKKLIVAILISAIALAGCGNPRTITVSGADKEYPTYGLLNPDDKSDSVCYKISVGNVVWSIILIETIVAPIYFVGFSLWEPIAAKPASGNCKML